MTALNTDSNDTFIVYEQPLNERVRNFLRLEHLFNIIQYRLHGESEWDSRETLTNLIEIVDLLLRTDTKSELTKELERNLSAMRVLADNPAVDTDRLCMIMDDIDELLRRLKDTAMQPGQSIRSDELITMIKQRSTIPGGTCKFDLPAYHYWLSRPLDNRIAALQAWYNDLGSIQDSVYYALAMIRNSATPKKVVATSGFFQQPIESASSCQLIRVILPRNAPYFPEISGGRHRFTIRFLEQPDTLCRPAQIQDDVEFELHCSLL